MTRQRSEQFLHKVEEEKAAIEPLRRLHDQWVTERDALEQQVREALEAKLQAQRVAFFGQLGQKGIGRRAGRTALAGEEFDDAPGLRHLLCMDGAGSERQRDRQTMQEGRFRHGHFQWSAGKAGLSSGHTPSPLQQEVTME